MIERAQRPGLPPEARQAFRVVGHLVGQDLERHLAIQVGIVRAIHLAHPACPKQRGNLIRAEARPGGEGHEIGWADYSPAWWPAVHGPRPPSPSAAAASIADSVSRAHGDRRASSADGESVPVRSAARDGGSAHCKVSPARRHASSHARGRSAGCHCSSRPDRAIPRHGPTAKTRIFPIDTRSSRPCSITLRRASAGPGLTCLGRILLNAPRKLFKRRRIVHAEGDARRLGRSAQHQACRDHLGTSGHVLTEGM